MRVFLRLVCCAVVASWAADAAAQGSATLWHHNGSVVSLSAAGAQRQFHYQTPTSDLFELGVRSGTLLFNGRRSDNQYSGMAYVFSRTCGALSYPVVGPVSADQRTVTMYGKAPVLNASCRVVGHRDDVLVFSFSAPTEAAANQAQVIENTAQFNERVPVQREYQFSREEFVEHLLKCLNTDVKGANQEAVRYCDAALSYSGSTEAERSRILRHRGTLEAALARPVPQARQQCHPGCTYCEQETGRCLVQQVTPPNDSILPRAISGFSGTLSEPLVIGLGIGAVLIILLITSRLLVRMKPIAQTVGAPAAVDFPNGVPIWFTLGVLAWIGVAAGGAVIRLERQDIITTQKRLGDEAKAEELGKELRRRDAIRQQQEKQNRRVEEQRREQEQIEQKRRADLENQRAAYERRVEQIAAGIKAGRCGGNPRGAYWCCDAGMWAHPGGNCSRSPPR